MGKETGPSLHLLPASASASQDKQADTVSTRHETDITKVDFPPTTYLGEEDRLLQQTCSHKTRGTELPIYQNLLWFLEKANPVS